jgi:hypothetical protein
MQINNHLARLIMVSALFTATTALPAMGQTNYPLRLRGSSGITTAYTNGNLFIQFQPGDSPAGNSLQPGQGSWLDRGLRPTEPTVLKQTVSEDDAKTIADYLRSENHFATFYCYNTNHGYFEVVNAETFDSGSASSNDSGASGQSTVVTVNGGGDSSGKPAVIFSGNTSGGAGRDHKDHRDDHKEHRDDGKEHREVAKKGHDEGKEHHEKGHHEGNGNHGIALVKTHPKPLVKSNQKPAPRVTTKAAPHASPKKKA